MQLHAGTEKERRCICPSASRRPGWTSDPDLDYPHIGLSFDGSDYAQRLRCHGASVQDFFSRNVFFRDTAGDHSPGTDPPISGSAALAVGTELMSTYGVDSQIGRTVAVMLGSTETTFYTISVYFGAAGIRNTRYTIPAALFADFVGFFMASITTRLFF